MDTETEKHMSRQRDTDRGTDKNMNKDTDTDHVATF